MQSRSRPLRTAALAVLSACLFLVPACKPDPQTHTTFTAVSMTPKPDAMAPPPSDGGGTPPPVDGGGTPPPVDGGGTPPPVDGGGTPPPADGGGTGADGKTGGCGLPLEMVPGKYAEFHLSIAGPDLDANNQKKVRDRVYFVRLPATYDPATPYRVVYIGPGCGGSTSGDVLRLFTASMEDAILVAMMPLVEFDQCFDETMSSVEYPYFDALHKKIESSFCVDPDRQFYAGFSTGARLGYMLDCAFPDVLRAVGTIQGAQPPLPTCKKDPIGLFVIADTMEGGNPYMANVMAASRLFAQNGCTGTFMSPMPPAGCGAACATYDTMAMAAAPPTTTCVKYTGCPADGPIVFCTTIGQGHHTFEPWSDQAFWNFFKAF